MLLTTMAMSAMGWGEVGAVVTFCMGGVNKLQLAVHLLQDVANHPNCYRQLVIFLARDNFRRLA